MCHVLSPAWPSEARGGAACAIGICSYGGGWKTRLRGRSVAGWEPLDLLRLLPISSFEIGSGAGAPAYGPGIRRHLEEVTQEAVLDWCPIR